MTGRGREAVCCAGLDGCRAGWVAALAFGEVERLRGTGLCLFRGIDEVVRWREQQAHEPVVAIDVPIGLPPAAGLRECDRQARALLGRRWMCVFEPPDRELIGRDFDAARTLVHRRREAEPARTFHVLTRQAVGIADRIGELDRVLREDPSRERWLVEVHPEVSFRALAGEDLPPKKTPAGRRRRLAALRDRLPDVEERLEAAPWARRDVARDDVLDAYVALWSALRFARGRGHYVELGGGERDEQGLLARMIV